MPDTHTRTQHTPGEWHVNGGRIEAAGHYTNKPVVVAVVGTINEQTPRNTANARLIAAAPDLLTALERILKEHADGEYIAVEDVAHARAAIAKARGEDA